MNRYHYDYSILGGEKGHHFIYGNDLNNARTKARLDMIEYSHTVNFTIGNVYQV